MSPREESLLKGARCLARLERTNLAAALTATLFHDHHQIGLFPTDTWVALLERAGFDVRYEVDDWEREVFIGTRSD